MEDTIMPAPMTTDAISIGLVGTYDVSNFGDCIFPNVYQNELAKRFPAARLTLYSPHAIAADILTFDRVRALPATPDACRFDEDCLILTGGETLSAGHSTGTYIFPLTTMSAFLRLWLGPTIAAAQGSTRFFAHSVGLAPGMEHAQPAIAEALRSADYVRLRDDVSNDRLGGQFGVAVDPVFNMRDLQTPDQWRARAVAVLPGTLANEPFTVFQISQSYLSGNLDPWCAMVSEVMTATGNAAVLLPICNMLNDRELLAVAQRRFAALYPALAPRMTLIEQRLKTLDTAAVFAASAGYIGTSLHGAVASVSFANPLAILSKDLRGKHAQTLAKAGVEGVVTDHIGALTKTFMASQQQDRAALRDVAIARAAADFDALCQQILAPRQPRPALAPAALEALLALDRAKVAGTKAQLKRSIFQQMRRIPALWAGYERWKFNRRFAG
jgi:polysaccharide pyruvyl transferase WcaK-like protein